MPAPVLPRRADHVAALYHSDDVLAERVASFVGDGLASDERVLVVCTFPHWNTIAGRLDERGVDYGRATNDNRLVFVDADEVVEAITENGLVRVERFSEILQRLVPPGAKMRIYGEVVSVLAQRGDFEPAMSIERLGEELAHTHGVSVLCGYHLDRSRTLTAGEIARVRNVHDHMALERESPSPAVSHADGYGHAVRFYRDRQSLARIVGRFLGDGFLAGSPAVVIVTPEHRAGITSALSAQFFDVPRLERAGELILVDAEAILSQIMAAGLPDPCRFKDAVVPLLERAWRGRPCCAVRAYAEAPDVLWKTGRIVAAVRLETLWNQLATNQSFDLVCSYSMGDFYKHTDHHEAGRRAGFASP